MVPCDRQLGKGLTWVKNNRRPLGGAPLKLEEIMKKLMTALAACLVAGFVVAQSVTSANVVGYVTQTGSAGFNLYAPMFTTVGSVPAEGKLSAITGNFADFDTIQFVDSDGNIPTVYQWLTVAGIGVAADGWYDDAMNPVDPTLPQGASYLLNVAAPSDVLNVGEVKNASVVVTAVTGFAPIGNATPTERNLSEIAFAGGITDFDTVQFVDQDGNIPTVYQWLTVGGVGVGADGWYDDSMNPVDVSLPAGKGVLLNTASGCTLTIPSPFAP